ncbi:hypothetical protein ACFL56_01950 [Candidatus Margulisiibacteriota bacterium]
MLKKITTFFLLILLSSFLYAEFNITGWAEGALLMYTAAEEESIFYGPRGGEFGYAGNIIIIGMVGETSKVVADVLLSDGILIPLTNTPTTNANTTYLAICQAYVEHQFNGELFGVRAGLFDTFISEQVTAYGDSPDRFFIAPSLVNELEIPGSGTGVAFFSDRGYFNVTAYAVNQISANPILTLSESSNGIQSTTTGPTYNNKDAMKDAGIRLGFDLGQVYGGVSFATHNDDDGNTALNGQFDQTIYYSSFNIGGIFNALDASIEVDNIRKMDGNSGPNPPLMEIEQSGFNANLIAYVNPYVGVGFQYSEVNPDTDEDIDNDKKYMNQVVLNIVVAENAVLKIESGLITLEKHHVDLYKDGEVEQGTISAISYVARF